MVPLFLIAYDVLAGAAKIRGDQLSPTTCVNIYLLPLSPTPNCPCELFPVAHNVEFDFNARVQSAPHDTCTQLLSVPTCVGILAVDTVPNANAPEALSPHVHKVPSFRIAAAWLYPIECCTHAELVNDPVPTKVGVAEPPELVLKDPVPNKLPISPHAYNRPSIVVANVFAPLVDADSHVFTALTRCGPPVPTN